MTERTDCIGSWRQLTMLDKPLRKTRGVTRRTPFTFAAIFALLSIASNIYAASPAAAHAEYVAWQTPQPMRVKSSPPLMAVGVAASAPSRGGTIVPRRN